MRAYQHVGSVTRVRLQDQAATTTNEAMNEASNLVKPSKINSDPALKISKIQVNVIGSMPGRGSISGYDFNFGVPQN